MKMYSTYKIKIKQYNHIFMDTLKLYRDAVDFFISVGLIKWDVIQPLSTTKRVNFMETMTISTKQHPQPEYNFGAVFYKFPSYLRRAAISEAIGKVSSYKTNYQNWKDNGKQGKTPKLESAGYTFPAMYRDNCFVRTGTYTARIKIAMRNTWDWLDVELRKSDVDYILRHCSDRKECVPTLMKRGRQWYLAFAFEEKISLKEKELSGKILAVDLGINNACVCSCMGADGTLYGGKFLRLPEENDSLAHALGRIKKAQQYGNRKTPRLWAKADGINKDIAEKTAAFITETAEAYDVQTIVFEHLDIQGKKRGSKKQRLHLWKAKRVQAIVTDKAHRKGIRISRVNAWGTSKLAFDGSGPVTRDKDNYSMCTFTTGKRYHADLGATYNIGARYFIREILKSLPETVRLDMEAKVPSCSKRSTCTFSTLLNLIAEIRAYAPDSF